jgi:RNA polymerase sigma factor (sigma-70 family)
MTSDLDLLRQFVRDNSQNAFDEIVRRHLDLVYSAALRQVRSPQLAEEIAQSVFADLARQAGKLNWATGGPPVLTAWLYAVTRRTAIDTIRKESRRQLREQIAVEMNRMNATANEWMQIAPLLDEAMAALDETDRSAVLLRYFENKSLREVGAALGASEDAAQKRVSRAVERLREFFSKRNVAVGTSGLVVLISTNAVQSAPVGLAIAISSVALAGTAVSTSTVTAATTKTLAMTAVQKALATATVAVMVGGGIYETRQAAQLRDQAQTLREQQASWAEQIQQLQSNFVEATNRLADLLAENARLKSNPNEAELLALRGQVTRFENEANDPVEKSAKAWLNKVNQLKEQLEKTPDAKTPELKFATEQDWLSAVKGNPLSSDVDYRRALSALRGIEENKVANMFKRALNTYLQNNNEQFPTDLSQLQPYFDSPMEDLILKRWEIVPSSTVENLGMGGNAIITQKMPVDEVFDTRYAVGPNGFGSTDFLQSTGTYKTMQPVFDAYRAAHNGQWQTDVSELQPYATTSEQQAALQKLILKESSSGD